MMYLFYFLTPLNRNQIFNNTMHPPPKTGTMDGAEHAQRRVLLLCKWVVPSRVVFGQVGAGYFQLQLHIIACKNLLAVFQHNALKYNWLYEEKKQSCTNTKFCKVRDR